MHNKTEKPIGGASIIPRARKSIHSGCSSCAVSFQSTMGRYGCRNENTNICNAGPSTQDCDEVDNIMSKMVKSRSPVPTGRCSERKNSLPETSEWHTSDDQILSKSLPACLKMDFNYRDEAGIVSDDQDTDNETSFPFQNESRNVSNNLNSSPTLNSYRDNANHGKRSNSMIIIFFTFSIGIISAAIAYSNGWIFEAKTFLSSIEVNNEKFFNDLNNLGTKYRMSDDSLLHLQTGISTISQRNDSASFIFVYNSKSPTFSSVLFDSFIDDMASAATRYLRNNRSFNRHLSIDSADLDIMVNHSELINKYRNVVDDFGLMLIKDVDRVPSRLAMAFHYYCDEFNPLVKKSAIFFTLDLRKCLNTIVQSPTHANIEKCLASKWTGVPEDNLRPLLTRVVNVIVDVTNVF